MYFLNVRLLYSLTVAFGMGTIAEILAHPIIKNIGKKKRERNIQYDLEVTELFEKRGWTVIRIWECELKKKNADVPMNKLSLLLK